MLRDIIEQNEEVKVNSREVQLLKEHFGGCFNNEGKFDLEKFRAMIGDEINIVEENQGFNFLGKSYARMIANQESLTVIRPDNEHNSKPENRDSENIYISGDNLDALKHLCKSYSGQVKCIYIDPPYNTGEDGFTYNDKFDFKAEELSSKLGINLEQAEHIIDMKKSSSASDAAWLTFMLPRLELAKDMLAKDGVIFISIDDNEQANLKLLCDEIFGIENFIADFIWEKRLNRENRKETSVRHDYILCYSRTYLDEETRRIRQLPMNAKALSSYSNPDNDPRGPWKSDPAHAQAGHGTENQFYVLTAPNGKKHTLPSGRCWIHTQDVMQEAIDDNRIWFGSDGNGVPRVKTYLYAKERGLTPETMIMAKEGGTNEKAKNDLKELFDGIAVFDTPKPVELVKHLLRMGSRDGLVMDFFGGASSTAQAIMELNAMEGYNIKYFMVQLQESCKPDSEAAKAGYKTIDEVGQERIRRAAKQIAEANPLFKGDLGFKHYTLEDFEGDTIDRLYDFDMNANMNDNDILSKFGAQTVLTTWLCRDGYGLNPKVTEVKLKDYTAYLCGKHLYLLDADFYQDEMAELIDKMADTTQNFNPDEIVVFGYGMGYSTRLMLDKNLRALAEARGNKITLNVRY